MRLHNKQIEQSFAFNTSLDNKSSKSNKSLGPGSYIDIENPKNSSLSKTLVRLKYD